MTNKHQNDEIVDGLNSFKYAKFNQNRKFFYINFIILATLNAITPSLIMAEAQELSKKFGKGNFVSAFQLSLTIFGIAAKLANGRFLLKIKHKTKIIASLVLLTIALLNFYVCYHFIKNPDLGFFLCIVSSLLTGLFTSIASLTCLGYMKALPPWVIGGYAIGSGIAGVGGAGLSVLFGILGVEFGDVCLAMILFNFLYLYSFFAVVRKKNEIDKLYEIAKKSSESNHVKTELAKPLRASINNENPIAEHESEHLSLENSEKNIPGENLLAKEEYTNIENEILFEEEAEIIERVIFSFT